MKEILNFYDPSFHRIFEFENFRFSFPTKNSLTWGVKAKIKFKNFRKS